VDDEDLEDCKDCQGTGEVMIERPVIDYAEGGYLKTYQENCDECDGSGWIIKENQ
jgi:DnaJ-class molecular chaperone